MGSPTPLETLINAWPAIFIIALPVVIAATFMVLVQRNKRGLRQVRADGRQALPGKLVAGFIDATPDNLAETDPSKDRRFITLHIEYDDERHNRQGYKAERVRAGVLPKKLYRRFFNTATRDTNRLNLNISDATERERAEHLARTEGYLMRLNPPEPVNIYRAADDHVEWSLTN
ncbi:hypothetical protein [Micrococcoides hystricis]|uniref:DUF3592 domain-containing protein n=1 Tax=Micrococcoides hystricis TaxID=1572761 RepID=A0ABV6PCJ2_9MICC